MTQVTKMDVEAELARHRGWQGFCQASHYVFRTRHAPSAQRSNCLSDSTRGEHV